MNTLKRLSEMLLNGIILVLLISVVGCSKQQGSHSDTQQGAEGEELITKEELLIKDSEIRTDIKAAIDAYNMISGRNFNIKSNGDMEFSTYHNGEYTEKGFDSEMAYAYALYGKEITGLFSHRYGGMLATDDKGSLYDGVDLISEDSGIKYVGWKTHNTNIDAYLLSETGHVYYYEPDENIFEQVSEEGIYNAMCRSGSYTLFFSRDSVATLGLFSPGGSVHVEGLDFTGWADIVVAAGSTNGDGEWTNVAAIDKNGKIYAQGNHAEDILEMGDLSYITMRDDAKLIVGLTPEGTLKFAGSDAGKISDEVKNMTDVAGIKIADEENFWIRKKDGSVSTVDFLDYRYKDDHFNTVMDSSGKLFYLANDGTRTPMNEFVTADKDNGYNIVLYYQLKREYGDLFGKKNVYISFFDFNGDGKNEVMIDNPDGNGIVFDTLINYDLCSRKNNQVNLGYSAITDCYQDSGTGTAVILVMSGGRYIHYYYYDGRNFNVIMYKSLGWRDNGEVEEVYGAPIEKYEIPMTDEDGDKIRREYEENGGTISSIHMPLSKTEFDALLNTYIKNAQPIEYTKEYMEFTDETMQQMLLNF